MPQIKINGADIYYEVHGSGTETIVFSHGLLWSGKMFHPQVEYFKAKYRVVAYDHRGQGRSEVTPEGYDMDSLYLDAVAIIEKLGLQGCHFAGLSMGGFIAMRIAARRPDLVKSVILMDTSADPEPNKFKYSLLNNIVKLFGVKAVTSKVMPIMFGKTFLADTARKVEREEWKNELEKNKKSIVKAVSGVVDRNGVFDEIKGITLPALVLVGDEDVATVPAKAERIHQQIAGSQLEVIRNAGHTSSIEEPEQVIMAIEKFLNKL